jgi:hypothetical protein
VTDVINLAGAQNDAQIAQAVNQIVGDNAQGTAWSIYTQPGDTAAQSAADTIMGLVPSAIASTGGTTSATNGIGVAGTAGLGSLGTLGSIGSTALAVAADPIAAAKAAGATVASTGSSVGNWLASHLADWGIIVVGVVLVVGAIMASEHVQNATTVVASNAGKLGAVLKDAPELAMV